MNHQFSSTTIFDFNVAASRFVLFARPNQFGLRPDATGMAVKQIITISPRHWRTPPTPAFPFPSDVGKSQGAGSAIGDHNTQYNFSPSLSLIRGKHTVQLGAQFEIGYDNYYQKRTSLPAALHSAETGPAQSGNAWRSGFADFVLGLSQNPGRFREPTEGVAQVPAQTVLENSITGRSTCRTLTASLRN